MFSYSAPTREEAWFAAMEYLYVKEDRDRSDINVILEVQKPSVATELSRKIKNDFNQLLVDHGQYSIHTVAETIFPGAEYRRHGPEGVFEVYPSEVYPIIRKESANERGTYAYRLLRGKNSKGEDCRPLENCINRMKQEMTNSGTKRAIYEISVDEVDSIPVYRNDNLYMGFPCLSHLSFKLMKNENKVHLTALYRSHYYVIKALGNLLGLARLLDFVAREVGVEVGTLVCHSTFATIDVPNSPKRLGHPKIKKFIDSINKFKCESA